MCIRDSMGLEVFKSIPTDAPLIVAEAVWQYSHHILAGLRTHGGDILTLANFAGDWPGLVGLLGLNAGLTKMGRPYSTIWSEDFTDDWFIEGIKSWIETGRIDHDTSHVKDLVELPGGAEKDLGGAIAHQLLTCLLYTSDAADDLTRVDLGGRRIIKKKK